MSRMTAGKSRKISYRAGLIQTIKDRGGVRCELCCKPIIRQSELTVDHIIPLSVGGMNVSSNWQPAHERCNKQKGNRLLFIPSAPSPQLESK